MIIKIKGDLISAYQIESVCRSTDTENCIEIGTKSGCTYEYKYDNDAQVDQVMKQIESVLESEETIITISDPDKETS